MELREIVPETESGIIPESGESQAGERSMSTMEQETGETPERVEMMVETIEEDTTETEDTGETGDEITTEIIEKETEESTIEDDARTVSQKRVRSRTLRRAERSNKPYSERDDQLIFERWWDRSQRQKLAEELGRSQAALAQRFYMILKRLEIDPSQYRRQMRRRVSGAEKKLPARRLQRKRKPVESGVSSEAVPSTSKWTRDEEISLWRWKRSGLDMSTIAQRLGRRESECAERYEMLIQTNSEPALEEELRLAETVGEGDEQDLLSALQVFPSKMNQLEQRITRLELEVKALKDNVDVVFGQFTDGLLNIVNGFKNRAQIVDQLESLKRENLELQEKIENERKRFEEERRELRKTYNEIDFWLGEFMKLRKAEKVASLGDLIPKLKYCYDRFGILLKIEQDPE